MNWRIEPTPSWMRAGACATALLCVPVLGTGCHKSSPAPASAQASEEHAASTLQGQWLLTDFTPAESWDPMTLSVLEAQKNTLTVRVRGNVMTAVGAGLTAEYHFEIVRSLFERVDLAIFAEDGSSYEVTGSFTGNQLQFHSHTEPWKGHGVLVRRQ